MPARALTPVHPGPGEFVLPDELIIVVGFDTAADSMRPASAQVSIDGEALSGEVTIGANTVVWLPSAGGQVHTGGSHTALVVLLAESGDTLGAVEWQFTTLVEKEDSASDTSRGKRRPEHNAFVYAEAAQYLLGGDNTWELTSGGRYRASRGALRYGADLRLSNLSNAHTQDRNVYRADVRYGRSLYLRIGDTRPLLNPVVLSGKRIRGFEIGAHAWLPSGINLVNLDMAYGQARRAAGPDTYARKIFAARTSFGSGRVFQFGLTFLSGGDDTSSISPRIDTLLSPDTVTLAGDTLYDSLFISGATPEENVVLGADFVARMLDRRVTLYGNYAFSLYTRDANDSAVTRSELEEAFGISSLDPSSLSWLITLNQSSLPLYSGAGILNSSYIDAGLRLNLPLGLLTEHLEVSYKLQGPNYHSMGNTLLGTGEQGFRIREKVLFLSNRAMIEASFGRYWNNLDQLQAEPTVANRFTLSASLFYSRKVPSLSVNYSYDGSSNNDEVYGFDNGVNLLNAVSAYNYHVGRLDGTLQLFGGWSRIGNEWRTVWFENSVGVLSRDTSSSFGAATVGAGIVARVEGVPMRLSGTLNSYLGGEESLDMVTGDANLWVTALPKLLDISAGVKVGAARPPGEQDYSFHFRVP